MIGSLYSGLSGLVGYQNAIDITGNNIANQNTTGFKYGRASFGSLFSNNLFYAKKQFSEETETNLPGGSRLNQVGLGAYITSIDTIMTTGSIESTGVFSDVAIGGNGFFFVGPNEKESDPDMAGKIYASRVGNFEKNMFPDIVQTSTGLSLYGFMAHENENHDYVIEGVPTEKEMMSATQQEKATFIDRLDPVSLKNFQSISAKASEGLTFSGVLNSQLGPEKMIRLEVSDNQGNPYEVYIQFDRDFSMLDNDLGKNFEKYEMNITVKDSTGTEITPISPSSKTIVFSPSGELLDENGNVLNNLSLTLPSSEITIVDSEISDKAKFTTAKSASYGDVISQTGEVEKVPFTFEKIEKGDWIMKSGIPESGEITQIRLKGATGEYIIADKGSTPLEASGVRLGFDASGNVTSEMIVDESGNTIETPESIVFVYADGSTQETTWETENLKQAASASDIRIVQDGGRTPGVLTGVEFSSDGYLLGNYSNQNQIEIAFIPLSRFRSTEALASTSSNPLLYDIKYDDQNTVGQNFYGFFKPGQGMTGNLIPYALESSNVDISKEMVNLIKYQRAIQLNARTVQTADEILQQAVQLKG